MSGGGVSFGGNLNGDFVQGDQTKHIGDIVQGDKRVGETNVGEVKGDFNQTQNFGEQNFETPEDFLNAAEKVFRENIRPEEDVPLVDVFDQPYGSKDVDSLTGEVFSEMKEVAEEPEPSPEKVDGVLGKFKYLVSRYGTKIGIGLMCGLSAGLKKAASNNPVVAGTVAFLESVTND